MEIACGPRKQGKQCLGPVSDYRDWCSRLRGYQGLEETALLPLLSVWPFIGTDLLGESSKRFLSALDLEAPLAMFGTGFDFESPGRFADFPRPYTLRVARNLGGGED